MPDKEKLDEITGTVEDISFRNEQSGFTVLELDVEDDLVIAVGVLPPINSGEEVHMYGHWTTHPKFGRQFSPWPRWVWNRNTPESDHIRWF